MCTSMNLHVKFYLKRFLKLHQKPQLAKENDPLLQCWSKSAGSLSPAVSPPEVTFSYLVAVGNFVFPSLKWETGQVVMKERALILLAFAEIPQCAAAGAVWCLPDPLGRTRLGSVEPSSGIRRRRRCCSWKRSVLVQLVLVCTQQVMLAPFSVLGVAGTGAGPWHAGSCCGAGRAQAPALALLVARPRLCPQGRAQGTKAALSACPAVRGSLKVTAELGWRIKFIRWRF